MTEPGDPVARRYRELAKPSPRAPADHESPLGVGDERTASS